MVNHYDILQIVFIIIISYVLNIKIKNVKHYEKYKFIFRSMIIFHKFK
jgi:hypothetical protein